jgi:hypothetical protein
MLDATGTDPTITSSVRRGTASAHAVCIPNPRASVQGSPRFLSGRCVRRTSDRQWRAVRSQCADSGVQHFTDRFVSYGDESRDGSFRESTYQRSRTQCSRPESGFVEARGRRNRYDEAGRSAGQCQARRFKTGGRRSSQLSSKFVLHRTSEIIIARQESQISASFSRRMTESCNRLWNRASKLNRERKPSTS